MINRSANFNKLLALLCLIVFLVQKTDGQTIIQVKNESKKRVVGALVTVKANDSLIFQGQTDSNGQVIFPARTGNYLLSVESHPFHKTEIKIQPTPEQRSIEIVLKSSENTLEEVAIHRKKLSLSQKLRESLYAPEVIDFKQVAASSKTVAEAINMASGVRIQQLGGMGSPLNIILNGIDGKDVRVFVDEIPVYLLGRGFELQNLSLNMIERIEIYKGLVPVQFGSDALGGIINIVTKSNEQGFLNIGYSYGSWNSQEATLSAFNRPWGNKKFYVALDATYRHSDNDYWMDDVDVIADEYLNTTKGRARRFNDDYNFGLAKLQIGIKDLSWADNFKFISSYSSTNKQWQHGIMALSPWGEPYAIESTAGAAINWKKSSAQKQKWQIELTAGYNFEQSYFVDTSSNVYFWDGKSVGGHSKGESGLYSQGRTPKIVQSVLYARENAFFKLGEHYRININLFSTKRELSGEDKAGTATYKHDPFKVPQILINNFLGSSLESKFLAGNLTGNTSVKHYYSKVRGASFKINNEFDQMSSSFSSDLGFGQIFKWYVHPNLSIIPGYEYTVRQPDSREVFGDYITISPNPNLKSAKGHNVNLKIQFKSSNDRVFSGIGGFYRNSQNRIILTSFSNALAAYTNLLKTSTLGGEWFLQYKPNSQLELGINTTYQDIRLRDVDELGIFTNEYIGARIPNVPYLFSNAQASYVLHVGHQRNYHFRFLYNMSYVHDYFLSWAINGKKSSKATIPSQIINDLSISVHPKNERWSFALDCKNLSNAKLYDNFSVQKAGRSFYGKITYLITKQQS